MDGKYESAAVALRNAVKGAGTDEDAIIQITSKYNNRERQLIRQAYSASFGRDLIEDLEDDLGGNLKQVIIGMYLNPVEYDAKELYQAFKGAGTDEDSVSEIIGSRNNKRLQDIKTLYKQKYGETLEDRVKNETSGDYRNLLVSLLQSCRDQTNHVDKAEVNKDLEALFAAGEGKMGTDEETFNRIFALRNSTHLASLNQLYHHKHGKSLLDVVESEFGGDEKVLLQTILQSHINCADYFAGRIYKACKGLGTNDKVLIRSLITTDENLLPEIKKIYLKKYGKSLEEEVKGETSGDYEKMLLGLISS
jgi:hypothetical protein